jgi:hypothetical protein
MGRVTTLDRVTGPLRYASGRRGYHGLRIADCSLVGAGGGGVSLVQDSSGIVFYDDFGRSDRNLNGDNGWVTDTGTWEIVSGLAVNTSGGNFDRNRQAGMTARTAGVYEARFQVAAGRYSMLRFLAADASNDWHIDLDANNGDKHLAYHALPGVSDNRVASPSLTMNSSFHTIKARYTGSRDFVLWFDHASPAALGTLGTPFHSTLGPTAAGYVGLMAYGGGCFYDWVLVSADHLITVNSLSTGWGFRLLDPSDAPVGSSGAESGGTATLSVATLFDGLYTGHLQVYQDPGTWALPVTGARYPSGSGDADMCGGGIYHAA